MKIKIIQEIEITEKIDRGIRDGLCRCFPPDTEIFSNSRGWHGSMPSWNVIIEDSERVAAHVGIIDRIVKAGSRQLRVAGIQNVFVLTEYRGQGLFDKLMDASMKEAERLGFDAGLLYCVPALGKVYARCGWKLLPKEEIIRIDENGSEVAIPGKNIAMFFPLKVTEFPAGTIHLQGNDW